MKTHHTKTKGDLGILKAQLDLYLKGYTILLPQTEHAPFDIVAYKNNKFLRVQVKYRASKNGKIDIEFKTSYADKNGSHNKFYDKSELDILCLYCPDTDECYYIDLNDHNKSVTIRVLPTKNNQNLNINHSKCFLDIPNRLK